MTTDPIKREDECYRRVRAAHRWLTVGDVEQGDRIKGAAWQLNQLAHEMDWQLDPPSLPSEGDQAGEKAASAE